MGGIQEGPFWCPHVPKAMCQCSTVSGWLHLPHSPSTNLCLWRHASFSGFLFPFFPHWKACNELCRGRVTKLLRLSEQPVTHLLPEAQRFLPGDAQRENPTVRAMGLLDKHVS